MRGVGLARGASSRRDLLSFGLVSLVQSGGSIHQHPTCLAATALPDTCPCSATHRVAVIGAFLILGMDLLPQKPNFWRTDSWQTIAIYDATHHLNNIMRSLSST